MGEDLHPVSLTKKLLSFNTINPPGQERECAAYLGKLLKQGGFKVSFHEFDESRTSLVARLRGGGPKAPLCFTGHMDTVPLGAKGWRVDPFAGEMDGDKLYGRGASDMKSGIAAMVNACLVAAEIPARRADLTLILTAGEETGSEGAAHLQKHGNLPGECGALVVGEPTSNYPLVGHKGSLWLELRTSGVTAHGSMPEKGVNAIYKAVDAVAKLRAFQFDAPPHAVLGAPTLNVGTISGGLNINSVPDQATVGVDIRTIPGLPNSEVYEKIRSHIGGDLEIRRIVDLDSVITDPEDGWMKEVFDLVEPFLGEAPVARGVSYFTDASVFSPAFSHAPTVILGPGEPAMAHKTDEFCHISRINEAAQIYLDIARRWCEA